MAKEEKKPTVRQAFVERLKREGREKEWLATVHKVMEETGRGFWASSWDAMRRLGYTTAENEWQLYREALAKEGQTKLRLQVEAEKDEIRQEQLLEDFEACVRTLQPVAPVAQEIQWISCHPAMNRRDREPDQTKMIVLTGADVLQSTAGKAPSQRAVRQLQHWCNAPREFFKQILGEDKKKTGEGAGKGQETDDDLVEAERLLKSIRTQRVQRETDEERGGCEPGANGAGEVDCGGDEADVLVSGPRVVE